MTPAAASVDRSADTALEFCHSAMRSWLHEDWCAVYLAAFLLTLAAAGLLTAVPKLSSWTTDPVVALPGIWPLLALGFALAAVTAIAVRAMQGNVRLYAAGLPVIFFLAFAAQVVAAQETVRSYGLEHVLWALVFGLILSNVMRLPAFVLAAARTELFIKTGLVLLGAEILFSKVLSLGGRGLGVGWLVPPVVMLMMYYFGTRVLRMHRPAFVATIAAETSVCGVSAAIAVGTAARATREEISYAISICLLFTVAMMVLMPVLAAALGLSAAVGGAWIGGTVDSTGAVVASGAMLGDQAMQVAAVVKMIQNTLIGMIAFVVALLWATPHERGDRKRAKLSEIWERFPKFILGFVGASLVFSLVLTPVFGVEGVDAVLKPTKELRSWLFAMAFVSIGLESNFRSLMRVSPDTKPIVLYVVGQTINVLLSLVAAWIFFG
jgi:uncharacterized integral membrane protein (TIGR00698 family)